MNKILSNYSYEELKKEYEVYDSMNKGLLQDLEKAINDRDAQREMQIAREGSNVEKRLKEIEAEIKLVEADASNIESLKDELIQLKAENEENMRAYQANLKAMATSEEEKQSLNEEEMSLVHYGAELEKTIKVLEKRVDRAMAAISSGSKESIGNQPNL